jgi:hypothetical protein
MILANIYAANKDHSYKSNNVMPVIKSCYRTNCQTNEIHNHDRKDFVIHHGPPHAFPDNASTLWLNVFLQNLYETRNLDELLSFLHENQ